MPDERRYEEALKTLNVVYWSVMDQLVERVLAQKELLETDLPFDLGGGFVLQEIEDQFAPKLAHLRQLMMELSSQLPSGAASDGKPKWRVDTVWGDKTDLNRKINQRLAKLRPAYLMDVKIQKTSEANDYIATIIYADRPPKAAASAG